MNLEPKFSQETMKAIFSQDGNPYKMSSCLEKLRCFREARDRTFYTMLETSLVVPTFVVSCRGSSSTFV